MKKILLSLVAMFAILSASAKQLDCDLAALPATSENTTWDAATSTFAWTTTWYNATTVIAAGDYSEYETLNYDVEAGSMDKFRFIIQFSNGTDQVIYYAEVGQKSLTWAELGVSAKDTKAISAIRLSGSNQGTGDVKVNSISLIGSDNPVAKREYYAPAGTMDIKELTGTNTNWASSVVYPKTFVAGGLVIGDGDGSNEATHVDVSDYDKLTFVVSTPCAGLALRVWMWNGSGVTTLYPHPVADAETANFEEPCDIKDAGLYVVKFGGLKDLKGIKAANNWNGASIIVSMAYVSKDNNIYEAANIALYELETTYWDNAADLSDADKAEYSEKIESFKAAISNCETAAEANELADVINGVKKDLENAIATGINTVSVAPVKVAKAMENGKVVIVKNGKKFNVAGQAM